MTTDPEIMIGKCMWWRILSIIFFIMLSVDFIVLLYEPIFNDISLKIFQIVLDLLEIIFRGYGIFFVGRFIHDLKSLFDSPMVQYDDDGVPIPPSPELSSKRWSNYFV